MSERFKGRVALVTGGASGIGLAMARRYTSDGGQVVIGDLNPDNVQKALDEFGSAAIGSVCDVRIEDDQAALARSAIDSFGRLDHAVACAGIGGSAALVNMPYELWRDVVEVCLNGVFLTIKHAARLMDDGGAIVAIASLNARQSAESVGSYNAAKAGVVSLTTTAAVELGHRNIRANSVLPGLIETPMTKGSMMVVPGMLDDWYDNTPMGRVGQPDEVANLICWLLSDEAGFVTAEAIGIDGGTHTQRYPRMFSLLGTPRDPVE